MDLTSLSLGGLFLLLGLPLLLRRVPPNRLYGLRIPATYADTGVWYDANARFARDFMLLGLCLLEAGTYPAAPWQRWLLVGGLVVVSAIGWVRAGLLLKARSGRPKSGRL